MGCGDRTKVAAMHGADSAGQARACLMPGHARRGQSAGIRLHSRGALSWLPFLWRRSEETSGPHAPRGRQPDRVASQALGSQATSGEDPLRHQGGPLSAPLWATRCKPGPACVVEETRQRRMWLGMGPQGAEGLEMVTQGMGEGAGAWGACAEEAGAGGLASSICSAVMWQREQTAGSRGSGAASGRFREAGSCSLIKTFLRAPEAASALACV